MQDSRRIFEYFLVGGLPENPVELTPGAQECGYRDNVTLAPITDIAVIYPSLQETIPDGFECVETTPTGHPADLNHGSLRSPSCYLCYRRGFHKPPIVDIGILYDGKGDTLMRDSFVLKQTPNGHMANLNNAKDGIFLTYRRAANNAPSNLLAVSDICVILANKGETAPHTFYKINKNLNKGLVGSDVYLCYKKSLSNVNRIAYMPAMLDRFPLTDFPDYPLPTNVPIFCLPMGAVVECWPTKCQTPGEQFSTFILTDQNGHKLYGASVSFYEDYEKPLTNEQMEKLGLNSEGCYLPGSCSDSSSTNDPADQMTFHTNKCICVVSRYPFFSAFRRYLLFLHRMCMGSQNALPVERYISFLMFEVPFPTFLRPRVLVELGNERICFDNPEDSPLPLSGANYLDFLKLLGTENCMYLTLLVLLEQKVLVHSLRPWYLTSVAEAICSLIFPLRWQCPYIPQCPLDLAGVLHAPLPFVAGVDSCYFELYQDPPKDVTCVDLDTNTISQSEVRQRLRLSLLPRKAAKVLKQRLEALLGEMARVDFKIRSTQHYLPVDLDLKLRQRRKRLEIEIQEAFLRFMGTLLKDYQNFLRPIQSAPSVGSTDLQALFDVAGFLRTRDKASLEFYKLLMNTQLFIRFIEERSFLMDKDTNAYLAFFDDCLQKMEHEPASSDASSRQRLLLELDSDSNADHRAVLFAPPESPTQNAKNGVYYCYDRKFPRLQQALFQLGSSSTPVDPRRSTVPQSPVPLIAVTPAARRTKQETKLALDFARKQLTKPLSWAKCLLGYSYSLWFIHLPAFMRVTVDKNKALNAAYCILKRMESAKLASPDEVCYRVLIQMCGLYENPILAVKVFVSMNQNGVRPNAVTYGIYNRAVLEAKWPGVGGGLPAQKRWALLRNVIHAIALMQHGHLMPNSASQSSRSHNIRLLAKNNISLHHRIPNADAADATTKAAHSVTNVEQKSKIEEEEAEEEEDDDDVVVEKRENCLEYNESCIDRNDSLTTVSDTDLMPMKEEEEEEEEKQQYPMQTSHLNSSSMIEAGNSENYLFNSEMKLSNSNDNFSDHECCHEKDMDENNICKNELDNFSSSTVVMQSEITAVDDDDNFMDSRHPLEIDIDEQQQQEQQQSEIMKMENVKAAVEMKLSSPTGRPLDKYDCTLRPLFVDEPKTPQTQQKGSSKHSFSGSGLSRFGRQSMRDFFTRINEVATPVSRFVRTARHVDNNAIHIRESKTSEEDINVASNNLRSPSLSSERSFALSPYLSDRLSNSFAEAQNKMFSKMSQFQKSSNSFAKLKSGMSLMVHEIRNFKSPYQLSGQVRGSWSSLSLNDNNANCNANNNNNNNNNISEGRSSVDDGYSTKNSCHGCIDEYSGKMELSLDDPAFALSSGMVNRMLNFSAMNGNDGGVSSCQVEVLLCTTSRCPSCKYLVYDDEIMAGWSADDSELNTTCPFCDMKFVPKLTAVLQPLRSLALNSWYVKESVSGAETTAAEDEVDDEDEMDNNVQHTAEKMDKEKISVSEGCSKSLDALHGFDSSGGGGGGGGLSTKGHHHQWSKMSRQISLSYGNFFTTFGRSSAKRPSRQRMVSRQLFRETDDVGGHPSRPGSFPSLCQENGNAVDDQKRRHVITVHYLNLIVLRKALENVVISDGDGVLTLDEFLETKPILFWNLVYVFQRLGVPTHLVSCAGRFYVSKFYGDVSEPVPGVTVRCVHELPTLLHLDAPDDGQQDCHNHWPKPVYWSLAEQAGVVELARMVSAEHRFVTRALVGQIVESLSGQNLTTPLQLLINEYRRHASRGTSPTLCLPKHFSMYRDMLFVALLQFGHKLRVEEFDLRYRAAFGKLSPKIAALLPVHDHPPSWSTIACRLVFIPLDVL
ncbi:DENN domain-containing protein 4C [Trichinella papuae]|uniref:DENN domain-containing protein 4C n=1 Tax=Trichinella papuae TaxID=268474 RepID=A0A0V1MRJ2_9BILA|nr:DENN domain-containing protein 4C [Trichinella papuae]